MRKEVGADPALFGHTHKLFYDKHNGLAMMNPGSIGAPLYGAACHHTVSSHLTKNTML